MHAITIAEPGGPEALVWQEVPDPVAGEGEVLVEVVAGAVNRADLLQRQGFYDPPPGSSPYPGLECSGRIAEVGPGVSGWAVGDEVCALLAGGGYAEKVAVPAGTARSTPSTARVSPNVFTRPAVSMARPVVCVLMLRGPSGGSFRVFGSRMGRLLRSRKLIADAQDFRRTRLGARAGGR